MSAIQEGVSWCDCTVTGMGRGAGNVTTESLLMELKDLNLVDSDLSFLQATLIDFEKLKKKYNWGPNLYYQFAANNNIHPTFVQTLLQDERYDEHQIFQCLENLSKKKSSSFSDDELRKSIYGRNEHKTGSWDATGWLEGKEVVLVGGGSSIQENKKKILKYIKKFKPEVIFININKYLPQEIGKATIVSHEIRAFLDAYLYKDLTHPLILPKKSLGKKISDHIKDLEILDYGLNLEEDSFIINPNSTTLSWPLSAAYAFAICTQAQAKQISLIGFDGYDSSDLRYLEMNEVIHKYQNLSNSVKIVSLTPTFYDIEDSLL